jgi:hypothetical protein
MTPATAYFASAAAIAAALQAQLRLVQLPNAGGAAFQRVELFDSESLTEAFQVLMVSEQRIAIVVPLTAHWEAECSQRKLLTRRSQPVAILISDRVLGTRTAALYGGPNNPGAFALAALAMPFVTGQLINNPGGVIARPASESTLILKAADKQNMPGRAAVALEIQCQGGWIEAALNDGPTL